MGTLFVVTHSGFCTVHLRDSNASLLQHPLLATRDSVFSVLLVLAFLLVLIAYFLRNKERLAQQRKQRKYFQDLRRHLAWRIHVHNVSFMVWHWCCNLTHKFCPANDRTLQSSNNWNIQACGSSAIQIILTQLRHSIMDFLNQFIPYMRMPLRDSFLFHLCFKV